MRGWANPTFAEWAISCIEHGETMTLFEDAFVSSIDVRAFARAALDLAERGATGLLNVAAREVFTKGDFIRALAEQLGKPLVEPKSGSVADLRPARAGSLGLDVSAAERVLGYDLADMQSVAAAVVGQYRHRQQA
jgi:dTDP-4-dehydrorhamnose reductase